jgi:hypothetical protein
MNISRGLALPLSFHCTLNRRGFAATLLYAGALGLSRRCLDIYEVGGGCIITPSRQRCPHAGIGISSLSQLGNANILSRHIIIPSVGIGIPSLSYLGYCDCYYDNMNTVQKPSKRLARWIDELQQYNPVIKYRPGSQAVIPDAFSRRHDFNALILQTMDYVPYVHQFLENQSFPLDTSELERS